MKRLRKWLIIELLSNCEIYEIFAYSLSAFFRKYNDLVKSGKINLNDYKYKEDLNFRS